MKDVIRILHLSDLHFGKFNRFADRDPQKVGKAFAADLAEARRQLKDDGEIDLVVVSGDVAESGKPREFAAGEAFLREVAEQARVRQERFVFVPGNHDISRPECEIVEKQQEIDEKLGAEELREKIDAVKLKHYDAFVERFYGGKGLHEFAQKLGKGGWLLEFPELRLSVGALSSCEKENHKDHVGHLGEQQAKNLMDAWRDGAARDWIKLVVVHHNPDLTTPNNLEWWREHFKTKGISDPSTVDSYLSDLCGMEGASRLKHVVADSQVQLVLHGHQHAEDKKIWPWQSTGQGHVLSIGSFGLAKGLPEHEPLSVRLIKLDLGGAMLEARRMVFTAWARTPHEVEKGAFVLDPAERESYRKRLDLPAGWEALPAAGLKLSTSAADTKELEEFLRIYRQSMKGVCSAWDLVGVPQNAASGRPIEGSLEEMYVELRFHEDFDPAEFELGKPIGIEQIRQRRQPLVVRGAAGTGKTTWMRRTFGRLLADESCVPFLLVLRDLSADWQKMAGKGVGRSLDVFIENWVGGQLGASYRAGHAARLLRAASGPRPVLLVDGWDEVGELGKELREKLVGLMHEVPRLVVIVTSRPYGSGRPSHSDGFETLEIQPLSDAEMADLARRFFGICHRQDQARAEKESSAIGRAFAASEEARALARTPLFLTMMLMISRSNPLPDKRHLLYRACVENLLQALAEKRRKDGVLDLDHQWRPDDSQERMRVVAKLAFEMQSQGFGKSGRGAIVRSGASLHRMLPEAWPRQDNERFLAWLAGPAGLMRDHSDGTYQFSHLSFQEFLAAWHLDSAREGAERVKAFHELGESQQWWETLQLWAALIDGRRPELLDDVLAGIVEADWGGLSLAGMILADGSANTREVDAWAGALRLELAAKWPSYGQRCLVAWRVSAQADRKKMVVKVLADPDRGEWSWLSWNRVALYCEALGEEVPALPVALRVSRDLLEQSLSQLPNWTAGHLAASRLLASWNPVWPLDPSLAGLLHLWPNRRRWLGSRLEAFAVFCPQVDVRQVGVALLSPRELGKVLPTPEMRDLASYLARDLTRDFGSDFASDLTSDFARDLASNLARYLVSDFASYFVTDFARNFAGNFVRYFARDLASYFASGLASYFARDFACDFASDFARYFARNFASYFARECGLPPNTPGLLQFAKFEIDSLARSAIRFALAILDSDHENGAARLFCLAARLSFRPETDAAPFLAALAEIRPTLHPIWPALAKHVCRLSTPEDKVLLLDYAEHPEKAGEPLCWGLQFIVRGDVMREDGSIVTLDEMSAAAGLEPLPLLEDMPPELEF